MNVGEGLIFIYIIFNTNSKFVLKKIKNRFKTPWEDEN